MLALTLVASLILGGCGPSTQLRTGPRIEEVREVAASPPPEEMALPEPRLQGALSLEETLAQRRSVRSFTEEELTREEISQLLWAAQGLTAAWGGRTAPSAGALYPLEVYVATASGLYHYVPQGHKVIIESQDDLRLRIWEAGLKQDAIRDAPAVFVITAVYERTAKKYGDRAERYVKLEAGHACQNVLLQAMALDLGAVPIGAFYDDQVQAALSLPPDYEPLYLIPVGHPRQY
jgi:SagB-type dehydrogenase family enzyme